MYNILMVDDDRLLGYAVSRYKIWNDKEFVLKKFVASAHEALEALEKDSYDIIITDIKIEGMDGIEFIRQIRKRNIDIIVIICSNYSEFKYVRYAMRLGVADYIIKPLTESKLEEAFEFLRNNMNKGDTAPINAMELLCDMVDNVYGTKKTYIKEDTAIITICTILAENIENDTVMNVISEKLELSSDYIRVQFKNKTGIQFNKFCTILKMEYAKKLLINTNMKIYEISEKCGYETIDYFTKLFKNYTGNTPMQYRKQ